MNTNSNPVVSVIIPTYNRAKVIDRSNKSSLRRKIRRLEQTLSGIMRGQNILLNGQVVLIKAGE
jgi:hypothetical protein